MSRCYGLGAFTAYKYIRDAISGKAIAYGWQFDWASHPCPHREHYSDADAQAVCDWLNERETGYPTVTSSEWGAIGGSLKVSTKLNSIFNMRSRIHLNGGRVVWLAGHGCIHASAPCGTHYNTWWPDHYSWKQADLVTFVAWLNEREERAFA